MGLKGEGTKNRIVKTAKHLFKYQGYKNTSIEDICKAANVKRGNLYFYFASKEELALAAIDEALKREFPFLERVMGEEPDPLTRLERIIDGMVGYVINQDCKGG